MHQIHTLQYDLHLLIERHTLPEVLDRLHEAVYTQSRHNDHPAAAEAYNKLTILLNQATEQALTIATVKQQAGEASWR